MRKYLCLLFLILLTGAGLDLGAMEAHRGGSRIPSPAKHETQISGTITDFISDSSFVLDSMQRVDCDENTEYEGISSFDELWWGDRVEVTGTAEQGEFLARKVRLLDDPDPAMSFDAIVDEVLDAENFRTTDGDLVTTDGQTVFENFEGVWALRPGDWVHIEGNWFWGQILATRLQLFEDPADDPQWISDYIASVSDAGLITLESGILVQVDASTELMGFFSLEDLRPGDLIEVYGNLDGTTLTAEWIYLAEDNSQADTIRGMVAYLETSSLFVLDDGTRVKVDQETLWEGLSGFDALNAGDRIEIEGRWTGGGDWNNSWDFEADVVSLLEAGGGGESVSREGWIRRISMPSYIFLTDNTRLDIAPDTRFENFNSLGELMAGDQLWIVGRTTSDPMVLDVTSLQLLQHPGTPIEFVSTVRSVSTLDRSFHTANGYDVRVDDATAFEGIDGLNELLVGSSVSVSGRMGVDPEHPQQVLAEKVVVRDEGGGDDGGGLVTTIEGVVSGLSSPDRFSLDGEWTIRVTEETLWKNNLSAYADLFVGLPLRCEIQMGEGPEVKAIWVEDMGGVGSDFESISGKIIETSDADSSILLDGGQRLLFDEYSILDGDAASFSEIRAGMLVEALAVNLGDGSYLVLNAVLTMQAEDVGDLGFEGGPFSESLVVLHEEASASVVAARHHAVVAGSLPGLLVFLFKWEEPIDLDALQQLLDDNDVDLIEPNSRFTDPESDPESIRRRAIAIDRSPTSDKYNNQEAVSQAKLAEAHERNHGEGSLVAVLDTGIDPLHPLMRGRIAAGGWDFVDDDAGPWESADGLDEDDDGEIDEAAGHGSFVAGLILLAAPSAEILPYRVLNDDGRGTTFAICEAILLAMDRGVDVINMSFAYPNRSRVLDRILMEASRRGIVLVAGAGNSASTELPFPAADNRVLAIAALDPEGRIADFSNRGELITVAAPGVDLYSASLDAGFGTWGGTSMAAPLVSGVIALLRSTRPDLTPEQIADALQQGASPGGFDIEHILDAASSLSLVPDAP